MKCNIIDLLAGREPSRGKEYLRSQRLRTIRRRIMQAARLHIDVVASGQLSKTSPFSLLKRPCVIGKAERGKDRGLSEAA